jgi:hypothetical protein
MYRAARDRSVVVPHCGHAVGIERLQMYRAARDRSVLVPHVWSRSRY